MGDLLALALTHAPAAGRTGEIDSAVCRARAAERAAHRAGGTDPGYGRTDGTFETMDRSHRTPSPANRH